MDLQNRSPLISEIFRGEWFLHVQSVHSYLPLAHSLLKGKKLDFKSSYDRPPQAFDILDNYGVPMLPSSDGSVTVPSNSIAQVHMVGEIFKTSDWCVTGADEVVDDLMRAQSLNNVDATVLRVDGPGGSVKAIGPFLDFKKRLKTKPIVGLVDDALSLHYWAITGLCDYIIAENDVSSRFGSVGVVASFRSNKKWLEKEGFETHEIYPDESEHKNLVYRLALEGKYDMIKKESLSPLAIKFQDAVREGRPNLKEETGVLTGKTFYADEALSLGMIDAIGGIDLAMAVARKLALKQSVKNFL